MRELVDGVRIRSIEDRRYQMGLAQREADFYCNARKKQGRGYCKNRAGFKTPHVGEGRCHLHGGSAPGGGILSSGGMRASLPKSYQERFESVLARGELWDMDRVMAHYHVLYEDWTERYDALEASERLEIIDQGHKILDALAKVLQRRQAMEVQGSLMKSDWQRALRWFIEDVEHALSEVDASGQLVPRHEVLSVAKARWKARFNVFRKKGR